MPELYAGEARLVRLVRAGVMSIALAAASACVPRLPAQRPEATHLNLTFESLEAAKSANDPSELIVTVRVRNEWTAPVLRMAVYVQGVDDRGSVVATGMSALPPGETLPIRETRTFTVR